jgi:hypothetical protein
VRLEWTWSPREGECGRYKAYVEVKGKGPHN